MKRRLNIIISVSIIILSLGFATWQMAYLAKNQSATTDEKVHIPAGFSYWKFKNYYLNPEHPPLAKLLVGLPIYLEHPQYPETNELFKVASGFYYDSWLEARTWGESVLYYSGNNLHEILFSARLVNIILTLVLILFLAFWGLQIGSWSAAALTAILSSFTPLILAHGSLANTDLLITLDFVLLIYFWWRYLKEKKWKWFLIAAFIFGISALSKFSFVAFIPVLFLTSFFIAIKEKTIRIWPAITKGIIFIAITWFLIMLFYGFSFAHAPVFTGFTQIHEALNPMGVKAIEFFGCVLVPIWYFKGFFMVLGGAVFGRGTYILGHLIQGGRWYYFPLTIIFKTPIGFLALLVGAICSLKKFYKRDYALQIVLFGGSLIYLAVAMVSKTNLGQRHIMPIYPLLTVFISQLVLTIRKKYQIALLILAVLAVILSTLFNFKNQIAYFNEFVGTRNGYKILLDSNYDWGQSLPAISDYISCHKDAQNIYLQYEWKTPFEENYYGFSVPDLKTFDSTKNATIIIDPASYETEEFSWIKKLRVVDRVANTIFVLRYDSGTYDLTP
ncbi:MAG: glycosyltransferase family 39 protein [Candidatus Berkelbacteria bacterium]|nr:glycosyltransferase family 39 protein [Candidatus Berkelbacteria bacterium]